MDSPDLYGGAAVVTKNIYREKGLATWTEVAGTGSITTANPNDVLEVVFGEGSDDDAAEPYGCKIEYLVPCSETPTLSAIDYCKDGALAGVVDDATAANLGVVIIDPEDGNAITSSATVDIDNGDIMSIETRWQGLFETDFGNRFTPCENVLVYHYHTKAYTKISATTLAGVPYAPATAVPSAHTVAANYVDKAYKVPVLKSNALWSFYTVADLSGSGIEANETYGNFSIWLYDNNWFINNDVTPSRIDCGVESEDNVDIGATGADEANVYLAPD